MRTTRVAVMIAFATFSSVCVAGEAPDKISMVLIEGGSYPIGSADGLSLWDVFPGGPLASFSVQTMDGDA